MTDRTHPESDEIGGTRSRATGIDYVHLIQRGLECFTRGEIEAADASFKRATEKFPDGADGWANRSATLLMLDQTAFALECAERALALGAQSEPSGTNRALALMQLGRYRDAIAAHDEILARDRRRTDILVERGNASRALGEPENALTDYRKALAIDRDLLSALTNCGSVLLELGDAQGALLNYESALAVNAASADALTGKGAALAHLRRFDEAAACHRQALTLAPENAEAHNNLGGALLNLNRVDDALAAFDRAIQFKPGWPVPLANRGNALLLAKRYAEATETFGKVVALDESYDYALGDLMLSRIQNCDWSEYDYGKTRIDALVSRGIPAIKPLTTALLFDDPNLARRCAEIYTHRKIGTAESRRGINLPRTESERIRVAYVSADFREHAASYLLAGLFERHDRKNFEIFGIGCSPPENSSTRRRIVDACDTFVDASAWDDEKLRVFFRESRIDIVVDLTGHTRNGRTTLFALDTGAVHVNYLGYPGTMGHQAYDYIVADRYIVTDANRVAFTERVIRLPDTYQANDKNQSHPAKASTRADHGLPAEGFVFCCFNNCNKITPQVFEVWMHLLRNVKNSVLWLLKDTESAKVNLIREAESRGVGSHRLIFSPKLPHGSHLERHHHIDLFLDTVPCNAHTTASDALWMGVPLITCCGEGFASRVAGSLLRAIEMPELITTSLPDYKALAQKLATDTDALRNIREKIARQRLTGPLFDTDRFARHLEAAYAMMYDRHVQGLPPADFDVPPITGPSV